MEILATSAQTTAMFNNSFSPFSLDGIARNRSSSFQAAALSMSVVIAVLSPVAVAGNALVLAAIWRNPSRRTPSYIILCGLAFTTGLLTQPFYVAFNLICLEEGIENNQISLLLVLTNIFGTFFTSLTLVLVTLMSIERWLHMTRRSLLTVR